MIKKSEFIILIYLFSCLISKSQVLVKVFVKDSIESIPISGVTIKVHKEDSLLRIRTTNSVGEIDIQIDTASNIKLEILHMGYEPEMFSINNRNFNDTIIINLIRSYKVMDSIQIHEQRVIYHPDKTIYLVNPLEFSMNQTSIDVFKKTPTISVINFEVRIMGDKNVSFMLNGKEVDYELIKTLPANYINKIEIREPNIKIKEGKFTIINIISTKGVDGYMVTANQALGTRSRLTSSISGKIKKNRFSVNQSLQFHKYKNEGSHSLVNVTEEDEMLYEGKRNLKFKNLVFTNDMIYDIDSSTSISFYVNYMRTPSSLKINTVFQNNQSESYINSINNSLNTSLQYRKNNNNSLLESSIHYLANHQKDLLNSIDGVNTENNSIINVKQLALQTDFASQINTPINYNIGSKYLFRENMNEFIFLNKSENQIQKEKIFSIYSGGEWKNKIIDIIATLKLEVYKGYLLSRNDRNLNNINLLYTFILSKKINNKNSFRLNWSKVVYRPSIKLLSLFSNNQDINNIRVGNDQLSPEIQQILRLSYSTQLSDIYISFANSFKVSSNEISPYFKSDNDTITKSFININKKISYTPSLNISYNKGILNNQINVSYNFFNVYDTNIKISNPNLSSYNLMYTFDVSLHKKWSIDGNIMYDSGVSYYQSKDKGILYADISINKELNKRFRISLEYIDIFNRSSNFINRLYIDNLYNQNILYNSNILRARISYTIGKDFNIRSSRQINNNDIKDF